MKYIKQYEKVIDFETQKEFVNTVTNNDDVKLNKLIKKYKGESFDFNYNKGYTPLLYAAQFDCEKTAKILIDNGVDINRQTDNGLTPLMLSAAHNNRKIMELLIDAGADWFITNDVNETFFDYIQTKGTEKWIIKKYPKQYELFINTNKYNL